MKGVGVVKKENRLAVATLSKWTTLPLIHPHLPQPREKRTPPWHQNTIVPGMAVSCARPPASNSTAQYNITGAVVAVRYGLQLCHCLPCSTGNPAAAASCAMPGTFGGVQWTLLPG